MICNCGASNFYIDSFMLVSRKSDFFPGWTQRCLIFCVRYTRFILILVWIGLCML